METITGFWKALVRHRGGRAQTGSRSGVPGTFAVCWVLIGTLLAVGCCLDTATAHIEVGDGVGIAGTLSAAAFESAATRTATVLESPESAPSASRSSASGAVTVSASVRAVRLLVVDDQDRIISVYSNTGVTASDFRLTARRAAPDGPQLDPIPDAALREYGRLEHHIDWSQRGLVYPSR